MRWVLGSILHAGAIVLFSFPSVLHDWSNRGRGICYPVSGMKHIKELLLPIGKRNPCGSSGFPLSQSSPLPYV